MKRSTIELEDTHYNALKMRALSSKTSLKNILKLVIHLGLESLERSNATPKNFAPPVVRGSGPAQVDISDRNALFGVFDRDIPK
jgi:hypothetical protein